MKKITQRLLLAVFVIGIFGAQAQEIQTQNDTLQSSQDNKNAVALYLGLPGIGVGYARKLNEHIAIRAKATFFSFNVLREGVDLNGRQVDLDATFKYNTADLLFDFTPFKNSSFKLVAGLAYLTKSKADIVIKPASGMTYGDIKLSKDQIGDVKAGADWAGLTPYMAMGFGRAVPKNNVGFGVEFGGYFMGKPTTTFEATGMLTPTAAEEEDEFKSWMNKFTFMPSIMFHLNYKF